MKSADNLFVSHSENSLRLVEFIFGLAAARALPVGGQIFKDDGQFVFVERLVGVGNVAVQHVENPVALGDDNAVAGGVSDRLNQINAVSDFLATCRFWRWGISPARRYGQRVCA